MWRTQGWLRTVNDSEGLGTVGNADLEVWSMEYEQWRVGKLPGWIAVSELLREAVSDSLLRSSDLALSRKLSTLISFSAHVYLCVQVCTHVHGGRRSMSRVSVVLHLSVSLELTDSNLWFPPQ